MIKFEWDGIKADSNIKKHGISFEEAKSVFYDELAVQFLQNDNEEGEERFLLLGLSLAHKVLMICHCERNSGDIVRIISARKATKNERRFYEGAENEK